MRILITGGNGFLGSNTTRRLLEEGHTILVLSRKCDSLVDILDRIQFIRYDNDYSKLIYDFSPDYVVHFAWDGGNNYKDVDNTSQFSNIQSGMTLLKLLNSLQKKPTFIGVGSFSEYGIITEKAKESQEDNPITMYGMAKSAFKTISQRYCEQNDIHWSWIRPSYVYGTNDVSTRLIPSVVHKLLVNEDVLLDSCNVTIDYLHVSDFCSAVQVIIQTNSIGIFNICSSEEYVLRNILHTIKAVTNTHSIVSFDHTLDRQSLSRYICGDHSRLKSLGWKPRIDILTGITEIVKDKRIELFLKSNPVDHDGLHLTE